MAMIRRRGALANYAAAMLLGCASAASATEAPPDLSGMSIEELAQLEVTSVSKRAQPLSDAPAAIFVINDEDIRRSVATSLPEALRLAPNLLVQRINARQYSIGARGFNGYETSNKLLALIDGRSIYSTFHAGIFWEFRSPVLDDLDRIEVISGPGGTLWGPNAVNGVINVISKSALDTQGVLATGTAGARERTAAVRYGGVLGSDGGFRIFANGFEREDLPAGSGVEQADAVKGINLGFRGDWTGESDDFTLQGGYFHADIDSAGRDISRNLLARWTHRLGSESTLQVQAYYDSTDTRLDGFLRDKLEQIDLSVQHDVVLGAHHIVWGAGVRTTRDLFTNFTFFQLNPLSERLWVGNLFAQDSLSLGGGVTLIGGVKFEQTSFTGIEILPNLRVAWKPGENSLLWAAVSRAVRTPSRVDRDLEGNFGPLPFLVGGTFNSEELVAIEAGYRGQIGSNTSLSVSIFYNIYDGLRTTEPVDPSTCNPANFFTCIPVKLSNGTEGHSYGVEAWGRHQLLAWWRLSAGISTLHKRFHTKRGVVDLENGISLGNDPDFQAMLRSQMTIADSFELDVMLRGVDSLPRPRLKGYVEADARLAWHPDEQVELFVAGSNLFHKLRDESRDTDRGQLVARRVHAGTRLRF
jgi:iron complex outermembrane receptor protein